MIIYCYEYVPNRPIRTYSYEVTETPKTYRFEDGYSSCIRKSQLEKLSRGYASTIMWTTSADLTKFIEALIKQVSKSIEDTKAHLSRLENEKLNLEKELSSKNV